MPDYSSFSWTAFDSSSLEALARAFDYDGINDHSARAAFLASKFQKPTLEFVERAFFAIQHSWLRRNENVAAGVVGAFIKNGIGPREKPKTHVERIRFLSQCSNRNVFRRYFLQALLKYGSSGKWTDESDFILDTAIPRLSIIMG